MIVVETDGRPTVKRTGFKRAGVCVGPAESGVTFVRARRVLSDCNLFTTFTRTLSGLRPALRRGSGAGSVFASPPFGGRPRHQQASFWSPVEQSNSTEDRLNCFLLSRRQQVAVTLSHFFCRMADPFVDKALIHTLAGTVG